MKNSKTMGVKQIAWTICFIVVLVGIAYGILWHFNATTEASAYLKSMTSLGIPLVMIINTFCMWCAAGCMWMPFWDDKLTMIKASCIQHEINFVDVVLPYINKSGFNYAKVRLTSIGFLKDEADNMVKFRYAISILTKWLNVAAAMLIILTARRAQKMPIWESRLICVFAVAIILGIIAAFILLCNRVTVPVNAQMDPKYGAKVRDFQRMLDRLYKLAADLMERKAALCGALFWGLLYSLFEVLPFCIVALAIEHPEMIPGIIATSGLAIIVGIITPTPMGLIGFDLTMIGLLCAMGFGVAPVVVVVVEARLIVFAITASTGIPFWQRGMCEIEGQK